MRARVDKLAWTLSPSGRKFAKAAILCGGAGGFLAYYLPNTVFLDKFKDITQLYRNGIAVHIPPTVKSLVEEVMNDLGKTPTESKIIKVYTGYGFDLFHAGSSLVRSWGVVGIPINFKYSKEEDFEHSGITLNNQPVEWSSPAGESLKKALILSDDAKKFAIAREITCLDSAEPFVYGGLTSAVVAMGYFMASGINRTQQFYIRPRGLRIIMYTLVSCFSYGVWVFGKDMGTTIYEAECDSLVSDLGEKYAKGGLEFYEKVLQRNVALRSLLGSTGEKMYTVYGNDQVLLRTKHVPFTVRRDFFKKKVEEYRSNTKDSEATNTSESTLEPLPPLEGKKVP